MSKKITKIEKQVRRDRYNIYLDDKYSFSLGEKALADIAFKRGDELTDEDIADAQRKDDVNKAFEAALHILSYRAHSRKELADKLARKFDKTLVERTVQKVESLRFIDDEDFAREYVCRSKKGKKLIRLELLKKGIDKELAEMILAGKNDAEELRNARVLAGRILKRNQGKDAVMMKKKIYEGLARRGFSYDIYKEVMNEMDINR